MEDLSSPVVILGAGLAGLACALKLKQSGQPCIILEKSNHIGGRIQTSLTPDDCIMDHGFQVLLTSYPELEHFLDLKELELQAFNSGTLIYTPEKMRLLANPMLHPGQLLNEAFSNLISLKDKALVVKLLFNMNASAATQYQPMSTMNFLKSFGFSEEFIELFWRPFLAGVFLDRDLEVDSGYFLFLLKHFGTGRVAVPKYGMQKIPLQMSSKLDQNQIKLGVDVRQYSAHEVQLSNGERIQARAVVCAFNRAQPSAASRAYRSVTNYYFSTPDSLGWQKWLVLVPPTYGFHINNIAVMSDVSRSYAPAGQSLLSVSLVGGEDPGEALVAEELMKIAGINLKLKFVHKFNIQKALPIAYTEEQVHHENGIYYCGDYLSSPSINGALKSGRLTAEKILASGGV